MAIATKRYSNSRLFRCFHDTEYEELFIPINQGILNETEALCSDPPVDDETFQIDCCLNASIDGGDWRWYVRRDIFFAAACESTTRAVNNADGRYHTGAEQTWTRGQFSNLTLTPIANITAAIKALVQPKQYVTDTEGYRTTTGGAGFNEVCIPDGIEMPSSMRFSRYTQQMSTPDSNTGTELHTTSMVPRRLRTVDSDVSNPLHGNPRAVKRWALHFLLGYNETLNNTLPPGTVAFNPVHSARQFIAVNLDGRVYESVIHNLSAGDLDPSQVAPWLRNYVSTFRGASPGILYNGTKNAYTTRDASGYTLADYFQICPKVSPWLLCRLIVLRTPAHHLGVTPLDPDCYFAVDFLPLVDRVLTLPPQDYAEGAGHPMVGSPGYVTQGVYFLLTGASTGIVPILCSAGIL